MGDRANIVIEKDNSGLFPHEIYFYTHWRGSDIKDILKKSLFRGKGRWDDGQYLSRVIFCDLMGSDVNGLTGIGISTGVGDGEYRLLCVNMELQKVRLRDSREKPDAVIIKEWSFEEYVEAKFETED